MNLWFAYGLGFEMCSVVQPVANQIDEGLTGGNHMVLPLTPSYAVGNPLSLDASDHDDRDRARLATGSVVVCRERLRRNVHRG